MGGGNIAQVLRKIETFECTMHIKKKVKFVLNLPKKKPFLQSLLWI